MHREPESLYRKVAKHRHLHHRAMEYVAVVLQDAGVYCVPADDHCLYYALLHYLIKYEKVLPSVDVRQLRKILADYLLANGENICIAGDPITEWLPKFGTTLERHCEVTRAGIRQEVARFPGRFLGHRFPRRFLGRPRHFPRCFLGQRASRRRVPGRLSRLR